MRLNELIYKLFADEDIVIGSANMDGEAKFICPFHVHTGRQRHNASINVHTGSWCCYNGDCDSRGRRIESFVSKLKGIKRSRSRKYLKKNYGFETEVDWFGERVSPTGFSVEYKKLPDTYRRLPPIHDYITEHDFSYPVLQHLNVGIDIEKDENGDYLHDEKLILPYEFNGYCVGWSYKYLQGKYQYLFDKSMYLYNYDIAAKEDEVIVVEGPRDVWRLMGFGLMNTVCINGSSPSPRQINLILKTWKSVIFLLDGDNAGRGATKKLLKGLKDLVNIQILQIPEGSDPEKLSCLDEYLDLPEISIYEAETAGEDEL